MRIVLVADNTSSLNWGCRATSLALRQIIAQRHEVIATISQDVIVTPLRGARGISGRCWRVVDSKRSRDLIFRIPLVGARLKTARRSVRARQVLRRAIDAQDLVTHDAEASAREILQARRSSPEAAAIVAKLEQCDAVVVNGEGDMIFATPPRRSLLHTLAICALAKQMNRPVFYLNAMMSSCPQSGTNAQTLATAAGVLSDAAAVALRDYDSLQFARTHMPTVSVTFHADALFSWQSLVSPTRRASYDVSTLLPFFERCGFDLPAALTQPYIAFSGSSRAAKDPRRAVEQYSLLVESLKTLGLPMILLPTCDGDYFLHDVAKRTGTVSLPVQLPILLGASILASAQVLVSGRWHPSIMASLGGAPCVFMGSNSHKTLSIQDLLEYTDKKEYSAIPSLDEIAEITARTRALLTMGDAERTRLYKVARRLAKSAAEMVDRVV